jgi:lipopolysaccharide transport system ATP-binding protein
MSVAVSIQAVSKVYRLGTIGGGTLGSDVARWWARLRGRPDPSLKVGHDHGRIVGKVFWALDQVSFDVRQGEVVGVIGRNGAGKSTLLKILSQVTAPTAGLIKVRGRIASLLEVGTGFHPELTGRENVFLNGAILGMTRSEIRTKFDEIVAFSECEAFIDTPVKRYSSGMYVRLAFAVAAHLEPEILIVDEVLAVGDAQFQQKCLGKIRDVSSHGRTILFVSHSMQAVSALCSSAVLLKGGTVAMQGAVEDVVAAYYGDKAENTTTAVIDANTRRNGNGKGRFTSLRLLTLDASGAPLEVPVPGSDLLIDAEIVAHDAITAANVCAIIYDSNGIRLIDVNTAIHGEFLTLSPGGRAQVRFQLKQVLLKPGTYQVALWLGRSNIEAIDHIESAATWIINEDTAAAKHSEVFPGVYQCRFDHKLSLK